MGFHGPREPVYTISVAARLLGVSPSFLRQIEGEGLISPARTESNIRLYSDDDLRLLSRIVYLCRSRGVNLHGVRVILAMEDGESQYPIAERQERPIPLGSGIPQGRGQTSGSTGRSQDRPNDDLVKKS